MLRVFTVSPQNLFQFLYQYITWALPSWFIIQLGKCLILHSMNCKASTSPISLLLFEALHLLKWLESIATSKIFPVFLAIVPIQPVFEYHLQLPHEPSNALATITMSSWFLGLGNSSWQTFYIIFLTSSWLSCCNLLL